MPRISTILDNIDSGHMALPEFQRGYVWRRSQVRSFFESLYRQHPVGGLLVWETDASGVDHRGDGMLASGGVNLLLDGQQRITSLYGVIRGKPPEFFEGNANAFTGLHFNLNSEAFKFYQSSVMRDDPLWVDVTELMRMGFTGIGEYGNRIGQLPYEQDEKDRYLGNLHQLLAIREIDLHLEKVTGADKTVEVVVDIFNRVNSGGTKLSSADLALAKICADWPEARETMKSKLQKWEKAGFNFKMDWLLRSLNTVLTGEARYIHLHNQSSEDVKDALERTAKHIDNVLNMISGRLGLDHDRVFFSRYAVPVMARFLDKHCNQPDHETRDRLLFWYVQSGMWGRFSGATESEIGRDIATLDKSGGDLLKLIEQLRLSQSGLLIESGHFDTSGFRARFYPVLYMMTRMGSALDWGNGLPLKAGMLGRMNALEVHHIFPKSRLRNDYEQAQINSLANFCFLTQGTNLKIGNRLPAEYFDEIEKTHPGALESQWIPSDRALWEVDAYPNFLEARRKLLAAEANRLLGSLHHDHEDTSQTRVASLPEYRIPGGIASHIEEEALMKLNDWVVELGFPRGEIQWEYTDPSTREVKAIFDMVWPNGIQEGLTMPVAVLLDETAEVHALANEAGLRLFTSVDEFKKYVKNDLLGDQSDAAE